MVFEDLLKKEATENITQKESPQYGFLNPAGLKIPNNRDPHVIHYQPHLATMSDIGNTPNMIFGPTSMNPPNGEIESYKIWSVLNVLFFCIILGCIACYYSNEKENLRKRGDIHSVLNASKNSRTMNIATTVTDIILITLLSLHRTKII